MRNLALVFASILIALAYSARAIDDGVAVLSAGSFTTMRADANAYVQSAPALGERQHEIAVRGRAHFNRHGSYLA